MGGNLVDGGKVGGKDANVGDTKKVDSCVETGGVRVGCIGGGVDTRTDGGDRDCSERDSGDVVDGCESDGAVTVRDGIDTDCDAVGSTAFDDECGSSVGGVKVDIEDVENDDSNKVDSCVKTSGALASCSGGAAGTCTSGGD